MPWYVPIYELAVRLAIAGLLFLSVASVAVACVRQPALRIRWIECALVGCLSLLPLSLAPGLPSWSLPLKWPTAPVAAVAPKSPRPDSGIRQNSGPRLLAAPDFSRSQLPRLVPTAESLVPSPKPLVPPLNPRLLVAAAYLAGVGLMTAWWLTGMIGLRRAVRSAHLADERCQTILRAIGGPASQRVRLLTSSRVSQPFTFAWRRPVIVLPESLAAGDEQTLRWALAHEWSHVARGDVWSWSLAGVIRILWFYQPLVWWLRGQLRLAQDYLADAAAAEQGAAEDYAEFLTTWAGRRGPAYGLGIIGPRSELTRRVIMLVQNHRRLAPRCSRGWTLFAGLSALALAVAAGAYREGAAETAADAQKAVATSKINESSQLTAARRPAAGKKKQGAEDASQRKRQLRYAGRDFDDWRNQLLNDLEQNTRVKAIQALESFGKNGYGEEAAEAIGQVLPSDNDSVSFNAANALGAIGPPALGVLTAALNNDRASCRLRAAGAIGSIGPAAVSSADALARLCDDDDRRVRSAAAESLARIAYQSDALQPLLDRLIVADDLSTRSGVVQGLAGVLSSSSRPLPLLLRAARDPDSNIRSAAAGALAQYGPATDEVIAALKRLVHDPKEHVSANAVRMFFRSSDNAATAVPVLAEVLQSRELMEQSIKESDPSLPDAIISKLGNPGDAVAIAVPALRQYVQPGFESNIGRVVKAIDALGELGPAAKDAIPALEAWTDGRQHVNFNNGDSIEKHARRALEKIKGDPGAATEVDAGAARR